MIADSARKYNRIPWLGVTSGDIHLIIEEANASGVDEKTADAVPFDYFGISGDNFDPGLFCSSCHGFDDAA